MKVETVAIKNTKGEKVLINLSDYDKSKHQLFEAVSTEEAETEKAETEKAETEKPAVKSSGRKPKA